MYLFPCIDTSLNYQTTTTRPLQCSLRASQVDAPRHITTVILRGWKQTQGYKSRLREVFLPCLIWLLSPPQLHPLPFLLLLLVRSVDLAPFYNALLPPLARSLQRIKSPSLSLGDYFSLFTCPASLFLIPSSSSWIY